MLRSFVLCMLIMSISLATIIMLNGFRYEYRKFRHFLITFIFVMLIKYFILQHIGFFVQALVQTHWPNCRFQIKRERKLDYHYNSLAYLKMQLKYLKANLNLPARHKNETLNFEYKFLEKELFLYCKYSLLILFLVISTRNPYGYYNTHAVKTAILENRLSDYSLKNLTVIEDVYDFINATFIKPFNAARDYNDKLIKEPGWLHFKLAKLLGVVRLQQFRQKPKKTKDLHDITFDSAAYLPGWQPYNRTLYYRDKYWRTYDPWIPKNYGEIGQWLITLQNVGGTLYNYKQNKGYGTILSRNAENSLKILQFLRQHKWLDKRTLAVCIDFTLYNVDANMFSIASFMAEQTPFGNIIYQFSVDSASLLTNMDNLSLAWCIFITIYALVFFDFCAVVVSKMWWELPEFFHTRWNYVDIVIVLNNVALLLLFLLREHSVSGVLQRFQSSSKMDFVDFRMAVFLDYITNIALGFLVALTTLRLWKVLQFSSVFRMFTRTLYTSGWALLSTMFGIMLFLMGTSIAIQTVNGSYSEHFARLLRSLISILSFSLGFLPHTSDSDLSHGGGFLGFMLYVILMFVVSIFMINMFITLICDHFSDARKLRDSQRQQFQLTFWEFLKEEYSWLAVYFRSKNRAKEKESINLQNMEQEKLQTEDSVLHQSYEEQLLRTNRLRTVNKILEIQTEILYKEIVSMQCLDESSNESD